MKHNTSCIKTLKLFNKHKRPKPMSKKKKIKELQSEL